MWANFPGCNCLQHILSEFGFDNALSLKLITEDYINEIEKCINSSRESMLQSLNCPHATIYRSQATFKFLPGHRILIMSWPAQITSDEVSNETDQFSSQFFTVKHPAFSPILREIISCALTNQNRDPKGRIFTDLLMNFSVYIYILAGKVVHYQKLERFVSNNVN